MPYAAIESALARYHLDRAEAQIGALPAGGYRAFYEATAQMYRYFGSQQPADVQRLRASWAGWRSTLDGLPGNDPLRGVMIAELEGKRALIEFLEGNYFTAVRHAYQARQEILAAQQRFPARVEPYKVLGLFNVLLGAVPRRYAWITRNLGFAGNVQEGMAQLTQASGGRLLPLEAQLLLCYVEKDMLNDAPAALARLQALRKAQPANVLLTYFTATALQGAKQNDAALQLLLAGDTQRDTAAAVLPHWDYLLGKAYYYQNNHRKAKYYFARFLRGYQGQVFRTDARFRLGMALTFNGQYDMGQAFFRQAGAAGTGGLDEDGYARDMARQFAAAAPAPEVLALFRARNAYDGGYYDQALAMLRAWESDFPQPSPAATIELHYRYGRVFEGLAQYDLAQQHYARCVAGPDLQASRWLQAYACYYQGHIARRQGDVARARQYYEQALRYDDCAYQNGLENRCKTALQELRQAWR
ncbi:MAG: hypothetical protein OHK0039_09720 [Bacteroidia bacterium]